MDLEQKLSVFLYMYSLKDDLTSFKQVLNQMNKDSVKSIKLIQDSFVNACERNSTTIVNYYLQSELFNVLRTEDIKNAVNITGYQKNSKMLKLLLTHEKIKEEITYDEKLLYNIFQLENKDTLFYLLKELTNNNKYSLKEDGNILFILSINFGNKEILNYLFDNNTEYKLPKEKLKELILGKEKIMAPMFIDFLNKYKIELNDEEIDYLRKEKKELFNIMEKNNLFILLNEKLLKDKTRDKRFKKI